MAVKEIGQHRHRTASLVPDFTADFSANIDPNHCAIGSEQAAAFRAVVESLGIATKAKGSLVAPPPRHRGLAASPDPAALPDCGAGSGTTTLGPRVPSGPAYSHRSDHSCAYDASILPLTAGWPPALRARNRR